MQLHSVTKSLSRALVLLALVAFTASAFAQQRYVITNGDAVKRDHAYVGDKFLAIDYNGTTPRLTVADQFDTNCIWYCNGKPGFYYQLSSNGDRYYLDRTGSTLGLLTVRMGHGEVFESATQWYDWTFGVATQELAGDARYYWVILNADGNSWGLSCDTYGRPGINNGDETNGHSNTATCAQYYAGGTTPMVAATYTPLQAVEHAAGVPTAEAGGLLNATLTADNVINNGGSISATVTGITAYSSTVVPAYTEYRLRTITPATQYDNFPEDIAEGTTPDDYMLSGGSWYYHLGTAATHYYYAGGMHTAAPTHNSDARTIVSKEWTLSGDGARYLAVTPTGDTTQATVTTTGTWNRAMTATLTYTVTYSDGRSQQLQQEITLNIVPTAVALSESEFDITVGEEATFGYTLTPSGAVVVPTVSWTPEANAPTATLNNNVYTINNTATPGTYTMTVTAVDGVTAAATVRVHPAAPTAIAFGSDVVSSITAADGTTIFYTTDATVDLLTAGTGTAFSGTPAVQPGQTVYAVAEQNGLRSLEVFSARYAGPATGVNQTLSDGVVAVVLNDLEDHSWSYYSDPASPIRSLNPADVKITYYGNGTNNMTTTDVSANPSTFAGNASGVKVNIGGENENTFVYYKTLERDGADAAASVSEATGNLIYTTIPNPFQVRPTGQDNGSQTVQSPTRQVYVYGRPYGNNSNIRLISIAYTDPTGNQQVWSSNANQNVNTTITVKADTPITLTARGRSGGGIFSGYDYSYITAQYADNSTAEIASVTATSSNYNNGATATGNVVATSTTVTVGVYRGFYGWLFSSSTGVTVTDKDGNSFANNIIPAETEVRFVTSSEYGNEVTFTALWAQAYVNSGYNPDVTYERNFVVGSGEIDYPATYSSIYPNGTTNGTTVATSITNNAYNIARTLDNDSKFENMNVSGNTITAAGHNLIVGRGVSGTITRVQGYDETPSATTYTIRLESGTYNNYYAGSTSNTRLNSTLSTTTVFGCDYDRAKNRHGALRVGASGGEIYGGSTMSISSASNRNNMTFDWIVKSGNFNDTTDVGKGDGGDQSIYLGSSQSGNYYNLQYIGKRRITVEGGVFASIAGGMNSASQAQAGNNTYESSNYTVNSGNAVEIRVKGGRIKGSIYGAAAFAGASGDRQIVVTGGNVDGWIAGGCNGTSTSGGETYGDAKIYVGGDAQVGYGTSGTHVGGNSNANYTYGINGADGGNIFGAGCGIIPTNNNYTTQYNSYQQGTVGRVNNSTVVVADEATVCANVYGGGNYGYVREGGESNIYILGGGKGTATVKGKVFGGSNKQRGQKVNITMRGGNVLGGVYGGSNEWGFIANDINIKIEGGTVGTDEDNTANVHGGGYGQTTSTEGNVDIIIGSDTTAPMIYGDVYGGSAMGTVNGGTHSNSGEGNNAVVNLNRAYNANQHTYVTVKNGTICGNNGKGSVYGGGLGTANQYAAHVYAGTTKVIVTGGTMNNTFGANNVNGMPFGTIATEISGGTIGYVYGGGNAAPYGAQTYNRVPTVLMTGGHVLQNVYGGGLGRAAQITNSRGTDVKVEAGTVDGNVYGGGAKANVSGNTNVVIGK